MNANFGTTRMTKIREADLRWRVMSWPIFLGMLMVYGFGGVIETLGIGVVVIASLVTLPLLFRCAWMHREVEIRSHRLKNLHAEGGRR